MNRERALDELYETLDELRERCGGYRTLATCSAKSGWPTRGVYFFFESGETRQGSDALRVVRVGTHGLKSGSRSTLWGRLAQHRGTPGGKRPGGGNHRASIFRRHVGSALIAGGSWAPEASAHWWEAGKGVEGLRDGEYPIEKAVSGHIGAMPFLWIDVPDDPGPMSERGVIESNAIALLSDVGKDRIDPPSPAWLGYKASRFVIGESGLWNVNHVGQDYDPTFLGVLSEHSRMSGGR